MIPTTKVAGLRCTNRFELKYLITDLEAARLTRAIADHVSPDPHTASDGFYSLTSLYYDSADHRCYWEKIDGIRFRRKLRLRVYHSGASADSMFVEIKQRVDRVTQKRRCRMNLRAATRLVSGKLPTGSSDALHEEVAVFSRDYRLRPACLVRYERRAFTGSDIDPGLRITFDENLRCGAPALVSLQEAPTPRRFLPERVVVMEIKVNERIPYWLTEVVAQNGIRLARISKYVIAMDTVTSKERISV